MSDLCVRLSGVAASYSDRDILTGVDLAVHFGECLGICGPNGAGKTTLLRVLLGQLAPHKGNIEYNPVFGASGSPHELRRHIGYVPQHRETGRLPLTVFDAVLTGRLGSSFGGIRRPACHDRSKTEEVLDMLGLLAYRDYDLQALSGGLRQRVALGRAIVREPLLILMDEPTTHLDPESQRVVLDKTRLLNTSRSTTFIVITHDIDAFRNVCTRTLAMQDGRLKEDSCRD